MHIRSSLFVNVPRGHSAAKLLAVAAACGLTSACVGNPFKDARVDPRSPIAAEVATNVRPNAAYPTFRSIPPIPKDVRPHRQYGVQAGQTEKQAADLKAATADNTWTLNNSETFAAQARADAGPELPPGQTADTEAFAKGQKARATPPPPPPR
jgi:hypothetical protein